MRNGNTAYLNQLHNYLRGEDETKQLYQLQSQIALVIMKIETLVCALAYFTAKQHGDIFYQKILD